MNLLLKLIFNQLLTIKIRRKLYSLLSLSVPRDSEIRHFMPSIIYSKEDLHTTHKLVKLVAEAIKIASTTTLSCGKNDLPDSQYLNVFPGEHYRLINALVKASKAKNVVEIGTFTGMGALALKAELNEVFVVTFDVIEWNKLGVPSHFQ